MELCKAPKADNDRSFTLIYWVSWSECAEMLQNSYCWSCSALDGIHDAQYQLDQTFTLWHHQQCSM